MQSFLIFLNLYAFKISFSAELSMNNMITSGPDLGLQLLTVSVGMSDLNERFII